MKKAAIILFILFLGCGKKEEAKINVSKSECIENQTREAINTMTKSISENVFRYTQTRQKFKIATLLYKQTGCNISNAENIENSEFVLDEIETISFILKNGDITMEDFGKIREDNSKITDKEISKKIIEKYNGLSEVFTEENFLDLGEKKFFDEALDTTLEDYIIASLIVIIEDLEKI